MASIQILMRERYIPYTAVRTPSGILREWLVMPQGLSNAPATFSRCVTDLLISVRDFAPSYFDEVFGRSRAMGGKTDVEIHRTHVCQVLTLMRKHKLYANLKKAYSLLAKYQFLGASWVNTAYALIMKRSRQLPTGLCQSTLRD